MYTINDTGCYVDSARGIYATDSIVGFARDHGAQINHDKYCLHDDSFFTSEFATCEFSGEYEDEADNYMNENFPVENASWGRNENGDWGLWENYDND